MRHRKSFNHLGRKTAHRSAMLANMASSLILHKRIETTTAKAKALRSYVEPLITKSKEDTTHSRRTVFSYLQNKEAVTELFREVGAKVADRPGGYLRILKVGSRLGDTAEMCIVELVDYNENLISETSGEKAKTGRRRRGARKKSELSPQASAIAPAGEGDEVIPVEAEETVTNEIAGETPEETVESVDSDKEKEKLENEPSADTQDAGTQETTTESTEAKIEEENVSENPDERETSPDTESATDDSGEEKKKPE